jgi:hypothetical protein
MTCLLVVIRGFLFAQTRLIWMSRRRRRRACMSFLSRNLELNLSDINIVISGTLFSHVKKAYSAGTAGMGTQVLKAGI